MKTNFIKKIMFINSISYVVKYLSILFSLRDYILEFLNEFNIIVLTFLI